MAGDYKPNKKLDDTPYDAGRSEPDYPNVFGEVDVLGNSRIRYADPENPEKAFSEKINYDGSFESTEQNGLHRSLKMEVRSYTSGGHSHHSDGQSAQYTGSNHNFVARQDFGVTAGGTTYKGSGEKEVGGSAEGSFHHDTGGSTFRTSTGDLVQYFDGNVHYGANDFVVGTSGQRIETVGGEYWVYAQGNIDIGGDQKLQIHSEGALNVNTTSTMELKSLATMNLISTAAMAINSNSTMNLSSVGTMAINSSATMTVGATGDISIESQSKLTFKVGGSTIVMQNGTITITSGAINFVKA
jgi:hypothetical protein